MNLKHKVRICVSDNKIQENTVLTGGEKSLRTKLLDWLLGESNCLLILRMGDSVANVEVTGIPKDGEAYAAE